MKWSDKTWEQANGIYNDIIDMPFIEQLTDGTLNLEQFKFYMEQDAIYLEYFGRTLSIIAGRVHEIDHVLDFIRFAEGAIVVENALHESYFKEFGVAGQSPISPACHHYIHFLQSTAALAQVEIAMAAVLPCFWIYKKVGDFILAHQTDNQNPYQNWIDTYAGEEFALLVEKAISICDKAADNCTVAQQNKMTEAFVAASRLEWSFWDSAWKMKRWKN